MYRVANTLRHPMVLVIGLLSLVLLSRSVMAFPAVGEDGQPIDTPPPVVEAPVAPPPAVPTKVYRSVDSKGNVIFTDKPGSDAEAVDVLPANTMPPHEPIPRLVEESLDTDGTEAYTRCAITAPENDTVMGMEVTSVMVSAVTEPALQPDHTLQFFVNGKPQGEPGTSTGTEMRELYRGTYSMTFKVMDAKGEVMCAAEPVAFHVKRHSKLLPKPDAPATGKPGTKPDTKPETKPDAKPDAGADSATGTDSAGGADSGTGVGSSSGAGSSGGAGSAGGVGVKSRQSPAPK